MGPVFGPYGGSLRKSLELQFIRVNHAAVGEKFLSLSLNVKAKIHVFVEYGMIVPIRIDCLEVTKA